MDHPNLLKMVDHFETKNTIYFMLEYMEVGSLYDIMKKCGNTIPESLLHGFIKQTLQGLAHLHGFFILHGDIKGANILLSKTGICKLADFGSSTIVSKKQKLNLLGSPFWAAPEIIEGIEAGLNSDVWSIGCTLIELFTSNPPYWQQGPSVAMFKMSKDTHPPLPENISPEFKEFLLTCFERDVDKRASVEGLLVHKWLVQPSTNNEIVQNNLLNVSKENMNVGSVRRGSFTKRGSILFQFFGKQKENEDPQGFGRNLVELRSSESDTHVPGQPFNERLSYWKIQEKKPNEEVRSPPSPATADLKKVVRHYSQPLRATMFQTPEVVVSEFLSRINCIQLTTRFIESGYYSLESIGSITELDLDAMGITDENIKTTILQEALKIQQCVYEPTNHEQVRQSLDKDKTPPTSIRKTKKKTKERIKASTIDFERSKAITINETLQQNIEQLKSVLQAAEDKDKIIKDFLIEGQLLQLIQFVLEEGISEIKSKSILLPGSKCRARSNSGNWHDAIILLDDNQISTRKVLLLSKNPPTEEIIQTSNLQLID
eukprot:TRINITY_DN4449_c0_g1_i1.p1 TRINITY_DN4449_c0_g1~~TRINITY_DN4449_c0_g1_i1.p1  ORF type:complete len:638 (-),score=240.39 TRINITY_DN4449_c0_g1_i1:63-1697(-)